MEIRPFEAGDEARKLRVQRELFLVGRQSGRVVAAAAMARC